jgi:hypothetical protein
MLITPPGFEVYFQLHSPIMRFRTLSAAIDMADGFAKSPLTEGMSTVKKNNKDFCGVLAIWVVGGDDQYDSRMFYFESDTKIIVLAHLAWLTQKISAIVPATRRYSSSPGVEFRLYLEDRRSDRKLARRQRIAR